MSGYEQKHVQSAAPPPLAPASAAHQPAGPLVFVVLDGVGVGTGDEFDAVASARTPNIDQLCKQGMTRTLRAHGPAVGLAADSEMGNSEVGHNTLGAGRIFTQGANLVDSAIRSGRIWGTEWRRLIEATVQHRSTLHLVGLLSDGNVHASLTHLFALLERAAHDGVERIRAHVLLDGRDVPDFTSLDYVRRLEHQLDRLCAEGTCDARIASGGGRMTTTMDRYGANWGIVQAGWEAHVKGTARPFLSVSDAINTFRGESRGISDQDLPAFTVVDDHGEPLGRIEDGDAVLVFNFRGDRAIEISEAFTCDDRFTYFPRGRLPQVIFAAMSEYDTERHFPAHFLVQPERVSGTLSELLAATGMAQFACAETQKFGHITYFWNGNRAEKFDEDRETYLEIPSDQGPFQRKPEMKSAETAAALMAALADGRYRFLRANLAGGDMVGHTGDLAATRQAVEAIDTALGEVADSTRAVRGCLVVTADHGNAEDMAQRTADGVPRTGPDGVVLAKTSHSLNPVRFIIRDYSGRALNLRDDLADAGLANVAATLIELLGFEPPASYEASLLRWSSAVTLPSHSLNRRVAV